MIAPFDGKENMVNVTSRKRVEEAVFQKAVDEKNEAQQCCAYLREENLSLRRTNKKMKREKKEVKRALLLQKRKTKEMRKKAKATSPPNQKLCHKTAKEAANEADLIEVSELVESLFGPRFGPTALEFPELGLILTAAEVDKSCAAGSGSSNESLAITEAEVDEWFAEHSGSSAGSGEFQTMLGA